MSSAEIISKLQMKLVEQEQVISNLKEEIFRKKDSTKKKTYHKEEIEQLKAENEKLEDDIQLWTEILSQAQKRNKLLHPPIVARSRSMVEKQPKKKKDAKAKKEEDPIEFGQLDLRVGHIKKVTKHPNADVLYVKEIDCGEEKPRTVISSEIAEDQMSDKMVIVLCNLKPKRLRGIVSEGMVLIAACPDHVELLVPPPRSKPGDVVLVEGFTRNPAAKLIKKKMFQVCTRDHQVNENKEVIYKGVNWRVNGLPVTSQFLVKAQVK